MKIKKRQGTVFLNSFGVTCQSIVQLLMLHDIIKHAHIVEHDAILILLNIVPLFLSLSFLLDEHTHTLTSQHTPNSFYHTRTHLYAHTSIHVQTLSVYPHTLTHTKPRTSTHTHLYTPTHPTHIHIHIHTSHLTFSFSHFLLLLVLISICQSF